MSYSVLTVITIQELETFLKLVKCLKGPFYHSFESKEYFVIKAIAHFEEIIGKDFEKNLSDESLSYIEKGQEKGEVTNNIEALHLANYLFDSFNGALGRMKVEKVAYH